MNLNGWKIFLLYLLIACIQGEEIEIRALYDTETNTIRFEDKIFEHSQQQHTYFIEENTNKAPFNSPEFWMDVLIILFFTLFAGAMSGLTVGYLSIDDLVLELKSRTGTETEKYYAQKVLPVINNRHWLLVTLLVCNATAMEALPIFLQRLVDELMAVIISVSLVLFFGEIIPQALCTGPKQLKIASFLAPFTTMLMYLTFPISYPVAKLLDHLVGKHSKSRFVNTDLKGLIELHTIEALEKLAQHTEEPPGKVEGLGLHTEQADLMISALEIQNKKAIEMMIPIEKTVMIDMDAIVDKKSVGNLLEFGYSRIPVYSGDKDNIIGLIRIKQLIGIDLSHNKTLRQLGIKLSPPLVIHPRMNAIDLLREFRKGRSHMAFITEHVEQYQKKLGLNQENSYMENSILVEKKANVKILGIVTLEDILEKMINIEILDEDDYARRKSSRAVPTRIDSRTKFYKNTFTKEIAKSFIQEQPEIISSLIDASYKNKSIFEDNGENDMLFKKSYKEPLL